MDANELRLGNYVSYEKTTHVIHQLTNSICSSYWYKSNASDSYSHTYKDIEPIPLTEEWHNNFGVKINGFNSFEYQLPRKLNIKITVVFNGDYVMLRQGDKKIDDDLVSIWNKDLTKRDMYVHEWQNLYFALTGTELTIKES